MIKNINIGDDPGNIESPAVRSLQDSKILAEDMLKLTKHKLTKTLEARKLEAEKEWKAAYDALSPQFENYHAALVGVYSEHVVRLSRELNSGLDGLNTIIRENADDDDDDDVTFVEFSVEVDTDNLEFQVADERNPCVHMAVGASKLEALCSRVSADNGEASADIQVRLSIYYNNGCEDADDFASQEQMLSCSSTGEMQDAILALVAAATPFCAAYHKWKECSKALREIPTLMKELDMQATAARVQAQGGEGMLIALLQSTDRMLAGESLDGLGAALSCSTEVSE